MAITDEQIELAQTYQHNAAHDTNQRVRLVAGPGTGKSYAIGERVRWLLSKKIAPDNIYAVSFTNAASLKLRDMINEYCQKYKQEGYDQVSVSTLHSLGLKSLRMAGMLQFPVDPLVLDNFEVEEIFDREFSAIHQIPQGRSKLIREDFEAFSSTGQYEPVNYIPPEIPINDDERENFQSYHYPRTMLYSCVLPGEIVRQCVGRMHAGTLDPAELMEIEHLIVDEYQDFNPADIEFVNWIAKKGIITFVAGDDDQSIYSFRHATPEGIQSYFVDGISGDHVLPYCFRCTPNILNCGQNLLRSFPHPARIPKELTSLYLEANPINLGVSHMWRFPSATSEARAVAQSCSSLINSGISPHEIMILLCYTDLQLQVLQPELENLNIPFVSPKEEKYVDTTAGRFVLSILRLVCNPDDYVAYRIILGLLPGVGPVACNNIASGTMNSSLRYRDVFEREIDRNHFSGRAITAISRVKEIISIFTDWSPEDSIGDRLSEFDQILLEIFGEQQERLHQEINDLPEEMNLKEIRDFIWFDRPEHRSSLLEAVYERLNLEIPEEGFFEDCVNILTMHGVKGLDAQIVIIPGLEDELLPGPMRREYPGLILEAARMLYVSITRAKAVCILSFSNTRILHGEFTRTTPSRFVSHLGQRFEYKDNDVQGLSESEIAMIIQSIENL